MNPTPAVLGIDVANDTLAIELLRQLDQPGSRRTFANTSKGHRKLCAWITAQGITTLSVGMEATNTYHLALAHHLHEAGYTVYVINPRRIHHYAAACGLIHKTDALDAGTIARFTATQKLQPWQPPSAQQQQLRERIRRRTQIQDMITRENNRLREQADPVVTESLRAVIALLTDQLKGLQRLLQTQSQSDPVLSHKAALITSIPGMGTLSALTFLAEVPEALQTSRSLAAYAGCLPRLRQSGTLNKALPPGKTGNRTLRRALYYPALTALRCSPRAQALAKRLTAQGKSKRCILLAIAHQIIRIIAAVLKHNSPFQHDHHPALTSTISS
jgi:transposase